jgi:hypothetical protein
VAGLRSGVSAISIISILVPAPALAAPEAVLQDVPSAVQAVTREDLQKLPTGRRLEDLIRTCPSQTIPTVARQPGVPTDGRPAIDLNCTRPADIEMIDLFKGHNSIRSLYGAPAMAWDPALERSALSYATTLAQTGKLVHASREGRGTIRENISQGLPNWNSGRLFQSWLDERPYFTPGTFPNISTTGDWYKVGHISQVLWPTTTTFGCARTVGGGSSWLVCRYNPGGNRDGKQVGFPLQIAQGGPPVININNPVQQAPQPQAQPRCEVTQPDDLMDLILQGMVKAGYTEGALDPRDRDTEIKWDRALQHENQIQDRMIGELARVQGDVAKNINAYLTATSTWQERYVYIASSTTGLQGLLTNWYESRAIYEKADLAFALMNLGVGVGKLGFKAYKFLAARRAAAAAAETTQVAGAAGKATEATAAALGETQAFNKTLIPPGQQPNILGMKGYTGASSVAGRVAETGSQYTVALEGAKQKLATAKTGFEQLIARTEIDNLIKMGPAGYEAQQAARTAAKFAELDTGLVKAAQQAGVNVEKAAVGANVAEREWALMKAIAEARGWHDIPRWANTPITNTLLQARKILGGVKDAKISPQDLELLKSLKTYVEGRGLNFAEYLRTAAGEVAGGIVAGESKPITEIIKYYDDADINLLLKVLDTGGDAAALRNAVSPVTQASLNGLAQAGLGTAGTLGHGGSGSPGQAGQGGCGALDVGVGLTQAGQGTTVPGGKPTDAQLSNVLNGLGDLGQVGLGNAVDQFGVTDRFTAGQGYGRAVMGELWEFITSPSATTASFYYTLEAQNELLNLLQNERKPLVELGTSLDSASRALADLQNTLQRAGLSGANSYLTGRGPAELRQALDELQKAYDSGSDQWKQQHKAQMDERRNHITQKLQDLAETVADLNALAGRMGQVRSWLDSLRLGPDGKPRGPVEAFNPMTFVRLGSISLYLRGMAADAFGLTTDAPFRVSLPQPSPPANMPRPEGWDEMLNRMKQQSAAFDAAPEVDVDPGFDAWLNGLNQGK